MGDRFMPIVQITLCVALGASLVAYIDDKTQGPLNDPWFIPVIAILIWESFKT